ncbi:MAG: 2-amino-4-hydroxy-6-hydroxymethyldihydropteridine diphosphokinase [Gemmatimonadota bacterium]
MLPNLTALLALGANIGEPIVQLRQAVERLSDIVEIDTVSDVYVTEPVGYRPQPDFFNLVLAGNTRTTVYGLHRRAQLVEAELQRDRRRRNGPRKIDVDLLAFGDLALTSEPLTVPHPRMHLRSFVLVPLREILPAWRHPLFGATAEELLARLEAPSAVTRWGPLPCIGAVQD